MCRCYRNILPKAFTEATVSLDTFREMHQGKVLKRFSWFVKFNKSQLWIPSFRNISMLLLCLGYLSFFSSLIYSLLLKFDVITCFQNYSLKNFAVIKLRTSMESTVYFFRLSANIKIETTLNFSLTSVNQAIFFSTIQSCCG